MPFRTSRFPPAVLSDLMAKAPGPIGTPSRRSPGAAMVGAEVRDYPAMNPLNLPRPAWMTEELVLLEDQADRFLKTEFTPHVDKWHDDKILPREVWTKAGRAGLLCAMIPEEYGG